MWFNILLITTIIIFILYATILLLYRKWFLQLLPFTIPETFQPSVKFSIIIPARNEEKNIGNCIASIIQQNYPKNLFEIIVIDDHSIDSTSAIVTQLSKQYSNISLIKLTDELHGKKINAYKKKAIELAIYKASGEWIITTDADCIASKNWLQSYAAFIFTNDCVFIAAPVVFSKQNTILSMLQYTDFLSLQGITAASVSTGFHSMCNGANLAYKKETFLAVNGFNDIDNIASGDDMLLMNKVKNIFPNKIGFLFSKDAIITTHPMPNWKSFLNQRIRWASKADKFKEKSILGVLVLVYLFNLILFIFPFIALLYHKAILYFIVFLLLKILIELLFLIPVGKFFNGKFIQWFVLLQPIHICYTVIAGWLGKFGSYEWKERKVK